LIADDDEAFTYNKRVNRLATIQEHYMIVKAIERRFPKKSSPGPSMSTSSGSRPSGPCSTECVPKSPRWQRLHLAQQRKDRRINGLVLEAMALETCWPSCVGPDPSMALLD
jgi:hypothetical protein